MKDEYTWEKIVQEYEELFYNESKHTHVDLQWSTVLS